MTQKEKIELLKTTIVFLYTKEGRGKNYIAKLLDVDRGILTKIVNDEWKLEQGNVYRMTPSNEKFVKRNKNKIISCLLNDMTIGEIAECLSIDKSKLEYLIKCDKDLKRYASRQDSQRNDKESACDCSPCCDLDKEVWKPILGYCDYEISNMSRVRRKDRDSNAYEILNGNREVVHIMNKQGENKTFKLARMVAHAFVPKQADTDNIVIHIDGDCLNNKADNLKWECASVGLTKNKVHSKHKFKKVIVEQCDGQNYEFKTIRAFAKFYNVSESQASNYIDGEVKEFTHKITLIY